MREENNNEVLDQIDVVFFCSSYHACNISHDTHSATVYSIMDTNDAVLVLYYGILNF